MRCARDRRHRPHPAGAGDVQLQDRPTKASATLQPATGDVRLPNPAGGPATSSSTPYAHRAKSPANLFAEGVDLATFGKPSSRSSPVPALKPVSTPSTNPSKQNRSFSKCGFYKDAVLTGGKDYDNPLWILAILARH